MAAVGQILSFLFVHIFMVFMAIIKQGFCSSKYDTHQYKRSDSVTSTQVASSPTRCKRLCDAREDCLGTNFFFSKDHQVYLCEFLNAAPSEDEIKTLEVDVNNMLYVRKGNFCWNCVYCSTTFKLFNIVSNCKKKNLSTLTHNVTISISTKDVFTLSI